MCVYGCVCEREREIIHDMNICTSYRRDKQIYKKSGKVDPRNKKLTNKNKQKQKTLFIRTKHNIRISGVIAFIKLQHNS